MSSPNIFIVSDCNGNVGCFSSLKAANKGILSVLMENEKELKKEIIEHIINPTTDETYLKLYTQRLSEHGIYIEFCLLDKIGTLPVYK
uniref:Uncharacterized protein n=1 Tax=Pithovirus LCPAC001 TaxID=2506585 RepID=A0A481Z2L2_9VIRU|nr:MAG: hypothetical protein LCPAC001_02080 [Pithovirus LCPAC001]